MWLLCLAVEKHWYTLDIFNQSVENGVERFVNQLYFSQPDWMRKIDRVTVINHKWTNIDKWLKCPAVETEKLCSCVQNLTMSGRGNLHLH